MFHTGIEIKRCSLRANLIACDTLTKSLYSWRFINQSLRCGDNKQLLDEVEHGIMNYQNRGLCYLPKPKAEADNTDTRF